MSCEAKMRKCFDDHAGADGKLSRDELRKMVEEQMCCKIPKGKCPEGMPKDLFDELDADKDGQLTWEEFQVVAEKIKKCKENMGQQMMGQRGCNK